VDGDWSGKQPKVKLNALSAIQRKAGAIGFRAFPLHAVMGKELQVATTDKQKSFPRW
jgi:hypothetical protein